MAEICEYGSHYEGCTCEEASLVAARLAEAKEMGVVPGAHVVIHRWMFDNEVEGHVDPIGVMVTFNGDENGEACFGIVEDRDNLYGTYQVAEVEGKPTETGGEW